MQGVIGRPAVAESLAGVAGEKATSVSDRARGGVRQLEVSPLGRQTRAAEPELGD